MASSEQVVVEGDVKREGTGQQCIPTNSNQNLPLTGYHTQPASINTLPVELLTEIFAYFQQSDEESPDAALLPPVLTFIRVCKHWQAVSLSTPTLWSTITLSNPTRRHVRMVREWLKRSKNCPLTLSLEMIEDLDSEPEEWEATISATNKILRTVVKHLHRWKTVFFSFSNFPIQSDSPLLHLPPSPTAAPVLERVNVCESKSFTTVEDSKKFWQAIASYPSVRHVMWIDDQTVESSKSVLPNLLPPSSPESSWTNLTRLATRFIVDESLMEFLSGCKGLEVLHVTGLEQSDSTSTLLPRPRVCLPSLKKLEFGAGTCRGSVSVALGTLLDTLDLPMLETLELEEWACPKAWMELIQRSESRVKRISVAVDGNALLSLSLDDNAEGSEGDVDVQSILVSLAMRHLEELGVSLFCPGATDRDSLFLRGVSLKQDLGALPSPSMRRLRLEIDDFQLEGEVLEGMVRSCVDSELEDTRCAVSVDVVRRRPM